MALTPSFSVTQTFASPSVITLTDTSTGTDLTITSRRVRLVKSDGTYLVPTGTTTNYITWSYSFLFKDIDVLDRDYALDIVVEWLAGTTVVYTVSTLYAFTLNSELFYYNLTQYIASNQIQIRNTNYYNYKMIYRVCIDETNNAVDFGADINSAQNALNRAYFLEQNQNIFF